MELAEDKLILKKFAAKQKWKHHFDFTEQLFRFDNTIIVTDPGLHIVYASSNMFAMNGYHLPEVIGKKPSIFQGPETSAGIKEIIRKAISNLQPFEANLINYKKTGELVNFIAFENVA